MENNTFKCPKDGCGKNFRKENLLQVSSTTFLPNILHSSVLVCQYTCHVAETKDRRFFIVLVNLCQFLLGFKKVFEVTFGNLCYIIIPYILGIQFIYGLNSELLIDSFYT
jgi:hypothetical protein